jgi:hypothetical protein
MYSNRDNPWLFDQNATLGWQEAARIDLMTSWIQSGLRRRVAGLTLTTAIRVSRVSCILSEEGKT